MDNLYPNKMTVIEHLEELRRRIIASLVFFTIASICSFIFSDNISDILRLPALGVIDNFVFVAPAEMLTSYLRLSLLTGFFVSLPFILFQAGCFLIPAVSPDKREAVMSWLIISFALSLLGIMFSYLLALPFALKFLVNFAKDAAFPMISIDKYFSFAGAFLLIGAMVFQIPVIMALLSYIGILSSAFFRKNRKYAVVAIFIAAAIITPTQDIVNMLIFAVPMLALYEAGVMASIVIEKSPSRHHGKNKSCSGSNLPSANL